MKNTKKVVRESYAKVAKNDISCCCGCSDNACSEKIGYSKEDILSVPEGSNMGLGCGNPLAFSMLKEGDYVLDLGCGGGFDCFLASQKVGYSGLVVGVDMTPEMLDKARKNAKKGKYKNVEFHLGEIEHIPAGDNTFDYVFSNCVINLSTDKEQVFKEAYRVLKPGGKIIVSDIVLLSELPKSIKHSKEMYASCISGASLKEKYLQDIKKAGFKDVKIIDEKKFYPLQELNKEESKIYMKKFRLTKNELNKIANSIISITIEGKKQNK